MTLDEDTPKRIAPARQLMPEATAAIVRQLRSADGARLIRDGLHTVPEYEKDFNQNKISRMTLIDQIIL
ncbi:MAG: hypothetical protein ABF443_04980 [Acetobacter malorum]|uniref:hypothetical protein n=1 Tax=Acetobacter malorum TaxID=178901 RepID=UPI0039E87632